MLRKDLVTALVNAEEFEARSDAKGISVDDLREMVEGLSGGKKTSSKKVDRRKAKEPVDDEPKPKKTSPKRSAKATKIKPVKRITDKLAREVETSIDEQIAKFIRETTGYDFTVACVGGVFNDERLTVQIGLLPSNASDEDIEAYAGDMEKAESDSTESDDGDEALESSDDQIEELVELTSLSESKTSKLVASFDENFDTVIEPKLGDEVAVGTRLVYGDGEAVVIGYSEAKEKIAIWSEEEEKLKLVTVEKVAGMEIVEEEEEDLDEDALDDEEEDDLDDEEEDDLDDEGEEDDDDFDDFDEEL
jgi:hypothetical protein